MMPTDTKGMAREEWLEHRRRGLGSSDAAAIAGLDPYKSPMYVYLDKVGLLPRETHPPSEAAHWGLLLEQLVADEFGRRTDMRVQRRHAILYAEKHPYMLANIDRQIAGRDGRGWGVLEIKTTSAWRAGDWDGGKAPYAAQLQLQHQLYVTGWQWGALAALIGGSQYTHVLVERDEAIVSYLVDLETRFWEDHVLPQVPPAWTGSESEDALLDRMHPPGGESKSVLLPPEAEEWFEAYCSAKARAAAAEREVEQASQQIKAALGAAEIGMIAGVPRVVWKSMAATRLDTAKLRSERPEVYSEFAKESAYRKFQVREVK